MYLQKGSWLAHTTEEGPVHRVSEIIGKPIVSAETGDRLGSVSDVLVEQGTVKVVALVVRDGLLSKDRVLPFHDVQTLGGDSVLARTDSGVRGPREWHRSGVKAMRSSDLTGKPVVTAGGQRLGEISDLLINERTGSFDRLEVSARHLGGLRKKHVTLAATHEIRIGPDAVVVPDRAVQELDESGQTRQDQKTAPRGV
jgi:uncharacterized protein YrrD